jgi:SAM-dependent methyltransferase
MDGARIREAMSQYKFYHIIQLTETIATPGNARYVPAQKLCMKHLAKLDLKDKRVLDIGCRDGLFSFAAEKMGAKEVIGIDNDLSKPATEFLIPFFNSKIRLEQLNLYDLTPDRYGLFDVVVFPGVLYHLRYPFWGLGRVKNVLSPGGHLLIETATWLGDRHNAMLYCPTGAEGPYEPTSCSFFNQKGLLDTMSSLGFETIATENVARVPLRAAALFVRKYLGSKKAITRTLFHFRFSGHPPDPLSMEYWEGTHRRHTDGE